MFQVDLRGIVDLLSHHLYASPRVYIRELIQNAVDAITARRALDPHAPAVIRIEPAEVTGDGTLRIFDTGVGLTEDQVHELLATIGRSSKRDELGFARHNFLGQFGIGLLSCFLVSDEIRVETRAEGSPTVLWVGFSDGRYTTSVASVPRDHVGTTVTLVPRHGECQWIETKTVKDLSRFYASMLPISILVGEEEITRPLPMWSATAENSAQRREILIDYAKEVFGFSPFDVVDLNVPTAGLTGVAFVMPIPANPVARMGHRVYLKRILLTESAEGLLPPWAFFVRCVVDTTELRPTASRESLYDDSLFEATRESLGQQLRGWLIRLAARDPKRMVSFLNVHHLGVKALALHDDEMLRLVEEWWPMETNVGRMTLAEFRSRFGLIRYTAQHDEFRQISAVAAAQDLPLVNAGFAYDTEIIERLPIAGRRTPLNQDLSIDSEIPIIERVEPSDLTTRFDSLDSASELALRPFLSIAQRTVDRLGCEVVVRAFDPANVSTLYLVNRSVMFTAELKVTKSQVDDLWGGILDSISSTIPDDRPQLVLNYRNPLVRRIVGLRDTDLVVLAVEALYGQALLLGHHPIRPADSAILNSSFLGLLNRAVPEG